MQNYKNLDIVPKICIYLPTYMTERVSGIVIVARVFLTANSC